MRFLSRLDSFPHVFRGFALRPEALAAEPKVGPCPKTMGSQLKRPFVGFIKLVHVWY